MKHYNPSMIRIPFELDFCAAVSVCIQFVYSEVTQKYELFGGKVSLVRSNQNDF